MKNVVDKIITVLSGISTKSNQIQQVLQPVIMTNQQRQAVNTSCDQIIAKYFTVKDPLSDIIYLFKCQIAETKYEGSQLDIQEDVIVWDKVEPAILQNSITIMDDYYGSNTYKWAYGIKQNQYRILDLNEYSLNYLSIYNKGYLRIQSSYYYMDNSGMIKNGDYIINEDVLHLNSGILDSIKNIDNKKQIYIYGGQIKDSNLICSSGSEFNMSGGQIKDSNLICLSGSVFNKTGGNINNCQITIQNIKEFIYIGGAITYSKLIIQNSQISLLFNQDFQNNQIHLKQSSSLLLSSGQPADPDEQQQWFDVDTNSLYLYEIKEYDYNQFLIDGYAKPRFGKVYCHQGATLINYNGTIEYF